MIESLGRVVKSNKRLALNLVRRWEALMEQEGLALAHRLHKIRQVLLPLLGRSYLKTLSFESKQARGAFRVCPF
jgi:hypothetical protein